MCVCLCRRGCGYLPRCSSSCLSTFLSSVIRLTTEGWNKHSMIARSLCQLKHAPGLCLVWLLCGGVFFGWDNPSFCVDPAMKSDFSEPFCVCALGSCNAWLLLFELRCPTTVLPWKTLSISLLNFYSASSLIILLVYDINSFSTITSNCAAGMSYCFFLFVRLNSILSCVQSSHHYGWPQGTRHVWGHGAPSAELYWHTFMPKLQLQD